MNYINIVAILAVVQFIYFGILVGKARAKYGVKAPAVSGDENFERAFRVHMNTLEQLVCFLPALFMAGQYWSNLLVALVGAVYLAGRFIYQRSYVTDPASRSTGFMLSFVPTLILLIAGLVGAVFYG